jgi:predicted nucleic acid-binding Zn ribbon protein
MSFLSNEKPVRRLFAKSCTECGEAFETIRSEAEFCAPKCRMGWHNRRRDRGAELYDILMCKRYERNGELTEKVARRLVDSLCRAYRDGDKTARAGRKSWDSDAWTRSPLAFSEHGDCR